VSPAARLVTVVDTAIMKPIRNAGARGIPKVRGIRAVEAGPLLGLVVTPR
jgi:hypothetical protein